MPNIKEAVINTINQHIEEEDPGHSIDVCEWHNRIIEGLIDVLEHQHKVNGRLHRKLKAAEAHGEFHRLMNEKKGELK